MYGTLILSLIASMKITFCYYLPIYSIFLIVAFETTY